MTNALPTVSTITQNPNTGKFMCIMNNPKFRDSFIHNGQEYANYASALAGAGLDTRFRSYVPETDYGWLKVDCQGFVSPSGQYYAVVKMGRFEVRIDCANVHTLRKWLAEGVPTANFIDAFNAGGNVRYAGGWSAS